MESSLNVMNNSGSNSNAQAEEKSEDLPPGFRFHPTDEELVTYYLTKKILDGSFSGRAITEVDLNKCEPWDLPGKAKMGEKEWYFFSLRDRKYPTGLRTNRATEAGYWKTTGKDREIFNSRTSALVGMKKTLVFYKGRAPKGEKTNWVMHEYRLEGKFSYHRLPKNCKDEWVVCRIFQKNAGGKKIGATGLRSAYLDLPGSPSLPSLLESPYNTATAINDQETTGSIDSESGTSSKAHVSCFSTAMDYNNSSGYNFMGHHHPMQQGSSNSEPSDQLADMARYMKFSSYMQNIMVSDPRINMNPMSAALSNLRRDNSLALPGMQNLALPPPLLFPQMPLPSTSYPNFNASSAGMLRTLLGGQSGLLMDPSPSNFSMHDKSDDKANLAVNSGAIQWVNETDHHHHQQIKLEEGNVLSQSISGQPQVGSNAIQQSDGTAQCLSTDMNEEMSSVVCSQLNRSFDQVDPSSSAPPPVDLDSFWNFRDNSF